VVFFAYNTERNLVHVHDGFLIDSFSNITASIMSTIPFVYYAENHVGWPAGGRYGGSAWVVAIGFLILAAVGAVVVWWQLPFIQFMPRFIVRPTLFFVGLMIIADSFVIPLPTDETMPPQPLNLQARSNVTPSGSTGGTQEQRTSVGRTLYFIPAAMTTGLTTASTLQDGYWAMPERRASLWD
jgi:hypothetical protein